MSNLIQGQRHWKDFQVKGEIGVISTIFSEQFLERSYTLKRIKFDSFIDDIELNGIETVFIDNDLFETDHEWYRKNRGHLINYLKNNNKTLVVIQNTSKEVASIFKQAFIININLEIEKYKNDGYILDIPLLINEKLYNPISSKSKTDIIYLSIGSKFTNKTHNLNFNISSIVFNEKAISRKLLVNMFSKLKTAKVLYINNSSSIDVKTMRYIEMISYLQSTYVIFDSKMNDTHGVLTIYPLATTDNIIYTLLSNPDFHLRKVISRQRDVLRKNTMVIEPDLKKYLESNESQNLPYISIITSSIRKDKLKSYIERLNSQNHVNLEVVLVTHGFELMRDEIKELTENFKHRLIVIPKDTSISLGECLNAAINLTEYPVIAKLDDDDFYYKNYLFDQWSAIQYSNADVVGKSASFYYFENDDLYILRRTQDHSRFCEHIMGATIMSPESVMKDLMFSDLPRAVDSDYLMRLRVREGTIYATHPYEMCVFRSQNKENHTWAIDDISLFRNAKVKGYGNPLNYVEVD